MTEQEKLFFKGEEQRLRGRLERAITYYNQAMQIDPEHDDSLFRTGYCYLKWGQLEGDCFRTNTSRFEKAAALFQKLIDAQVRDRKNCRYHYETYHYLGEAQYHLAVTIMQGNNHPGFAGALAWRDLLEKAIENYKKAIELSPGYAESYHWLGNAQFAAGLSADALRSHQRAVELDPCNIAYHYPLAAVQEELGLDGEAVKSYNHAIELLLPRQMNIL